MTVTAVALVDAQLVPNTDTVFFTATGKVIIDKLTATNTDTGAVTLSINIIPDGGSLGSDNLIVKTKSLAAAQTYAFDSEMQNQILDDGDSISMVASVASKIVVRISGRVIS